jgi:hypothetical protein
VPYVTQTWVDGAGGGTPVNATRLAHIEAGLGEHETRVAALEFDTGWITVTIRTGFERRGGGGDAAAGHRPEHHPAHLWDARHLLQVRRRQLVHRLTRAEPFTP